MILILDAKLAHLVGPPQPLKGHHRVVDAALRPLDLELDGVGEGVERLYGLGVLVGGVATKPPTRSGASACGTAEAFRAPTRTDYGPLRSTSAFLLVRGRMRSFAMSVKSSASGATSKTMAPSLLVPGFMSMASSSRFSVEA